MKRPMSFFLAALVLLGSAGVQEAAARAGASYPPVKVVAAGDIASCDRAADERTAELVRSLRPRLVLTLGDNVYPSGTAEEFATCYEPSWGGFKEKTRPSPGNHDYATPRAAGYFSYFGDRAPAPYYSFNLGAWHFVSLNSEIDRDRGSAQVRWLRRDLERDRRLCEVAYWHRPRWSGGLHGPDASVRTLWRTAYALGVDVVLVGHDHNYQRFYRLDGEGRPDSRFGVLQIVAGTGGRSHYAAGSAPHRAVADSTSTGVVSLILRERTFDIRFRPAADGKFEDERTNRRCHGSPSGR